MSVSSFFITAAEILFAAFIVWGIANERKLILFERRLRLVIRTIVRRIHNNRVAGKKSGKTKITYLPVRPENMAG